MINYKEEEQIITKRIPIKYRCDICGKVQTGLEIDEMHFIRFTGGYLSNFGDMTEVSCDICDKCLYKMIGDKCRYNEDVEYYGDDE